MRDERALKLPAALVSQLEDWIERTDFWRLTIRAESILATVEINESANPRPEAWLCGIKTICITAGLRARLTPVEFRAAIAHEAAHIVLPWLPQGHAQLWEIQCDLLAAVLLRDAEPVKNMLLAMNTICHGCRDAEHLAPYERVALLDYCVASPLEKAQRLETLRARNFALPLPDFNGFKTK